MNSDSIAAEPMRNSADPISQFTPVEDAVDPIEDFSLEAGVNTADFDGVRVGGLFGAQSTDETDALQAAASQYEFGVTDDGFMSVQSGEVNVGDTILDAVSQSQVPNHIALRVHCCRVWNRQYLNSCGSNPDFWAQFLGRTI